MDVFLQKMRLKKNRKALIIEEAWKAIASPLMADYIKYLYKTVRKFWGTVGVVTQEIQDIISSPIVKEAIINNSDVMMLLDQSKFKERFDDIKKVLGLTDVDCKKIFTINRLQNKEGRAYFNEVFVRRGTESAVFGVEERMLYDLYHRTFGEGCFETLQEGTGLWHSGSPASVLPGLGAQWHQGYTAVRTESQCRRQSVESAQAQNVEHIE